MFSQDRTTRVIQSVVAVAFLVLAAQLFRLQVVQQAKYQAQSERNRIRRIRIEPPRGIIYDRHGTVLVENRPSYTLSATPSICKKNQRSLEFLAQLMNVSVADVRRELNAADNPFMPFKLRHNIDYATLVQLEEHKLEVPGVTYEVESRRVYPSGLKSPHVFGYTAEVSKTELEKRRDQGMLPGDLVGKKGFERQYDRDLRGQVGYDFVEVDALGREVRDLVVEGEQEAIRGKDFYLALDARLQTFADSAFSGKRGGAVMVDTRDGGVLVLCSKPDFDPELFTTAISNENWQRLLNAPDKPLYDRMLQSTYPPGSVYKMIAAAAALENHKVDLSTYFSCHGGLQFGNRLFRCWLSSGHGAVTLCDALKYSCDVYFYNVGLRIGIDLWADFSHRFGMGQLTHIDLPGEEKGLLPDRAYLDRVFGKKGWTNGMMLNLAIGQGDLLTTPVQIAQYTMMIANRGAYYPLHMVDKVFDPKTKQLYRQKFPVKTVSGISPATWDAIHEGMYRVVNGAGGTGRNSFLDDVVVAGKTGSAQNPHGETHAWFIAFAPYAKPEVAVCVVIENAGGGGAVAAPIAGKLLRLYFDQQKAAIAKPVQTQQANTAGALMSARGR